MGNARICIALLKIARGRLLLKEDKYLCIALHKALLDCIDVCASVDVPRIHTSYNELLSTITNKLEGNRTYLEWWIKQSWVNRTLFLCLPKNAYLQIMNEHRSKFINELIHKYAELGSY